MIKKMRKIWTYALGLACACTACAGAVGLTTSSQDASASQDIRTYSVSINANYVDGFRGVVSRDLPAENATKVTMEYTVTDSSGGAELFALMRGAFYGISYPEAGTYSKFWQGGTVANTDGYRGFFFEKGATYTIVYDLTNVENISATRANTAQASDQVYVPHGNYPNVPGADNTARAQWILDNDYHFGFGFRQSQAIIDANLALQADISVKCYDDTGKDLGITYSATGDTIALNDALVAPEYSTLTNFDKESALLVHGNVCYVDGNRSSGVVSASMHPDYASFVESEGLEKLGADGSVLKLTPNGGNLSNLYRVVFAKPMTKAQIDAGYDLSVRAYVKTYNGDYIRYTHFFSCDDRMAHRNDKAFRIGNPLYDLQASKAFDKGFQTIIIPNAELKNLADADGNINGFSVMIAQGPENARFELYLDSVSVSAPVTVAFHDSQGERLSETEIRAGYMSIAEQTDVTIPVVDGYTFVGWATEKDGTTLFNVNEVLALGTTELNLYAKYETGLDDVLPVVGVWANQSTGRYFTLHEDLTVSTLFKDVTYKNFALTQSGKVVFDNAVVADLDEKTITVGSEVYQKMDTCYTVSYLVPSGVFATAQIPAGYTVPALAMEDADYTFEAWLQGESAYDFATPIVADLTLTAKVTVNELADEAYAEYANSYKNKNGKIYVLSDKKDGKATITIVENAVLTTKEYTLTTAGNILVDGISTPITPLCIMEQGAYLWKITEEYVVTLYYGDEAGSTQTCTVDRTTGFVLAVPEAPAAREGYTFLGWYLGDGTKYEASIITVATSLYARWQNADEKEYAPMVEKKDGCSSVTGVSGIAIGLCSVVAFMFMRKKGDRD